MSRKKVDKWNVLDVTIWLNSIDERKFIPLFSEHEINGHELLVSNENDIKGDLLKYCKVGDKIRIWDHILKLKKQNGMNVDSLSNIYDKSVYNKNNLRSYARWNDTEIEKLKNMWENDYSIEMIAKYLDRTPNAISARLDSIGILHRKSHKSIRKLTLKITGKTKSNNKILRKLSPKRNQLKLSDVTPKRRYTIKPIMSNLNTNNIALSV